MRERDLPLSRYALIGDGRTAALVADDGAIDWLCPERFDGAAVLCRLLDRGRGGFLSLAPTTAYDARRRYVDDTNVLTAELTTATGAVRITDCMPLGRARAPAVLRRIEGLAGTVELRVELSATFDFARAPVEVAIVPGGCVTRGAGAELALWCPGPLERTASGARGTFAVRRGEHAWVVLTQDGRPHPAWAPRALAETVDRWRRWSAAGTYPTCYEALARRSALVLKLLTHEPSGAVLAAPTTSLPELAGGERNWDYRYCWLRDASWVVSALMLLDHHDESMAFLDFLDRLDLGKQGASIFYDVDGRAPDVEEQLDHLRGYLDARPVRVGNRASAQDQHDIFGEVIAAIHRCSDAMPSMRPLRPSLWKLVTALANQTVDHWEHADHGLWEVRNGRHHFLSSKLLSWTALDRAIDIARRDGLDGPLSTWRRDRDELARVITTEGFSSELGAFTQTLGGAGVDASALLLPRYGVIAPDDPRMRSTVQVIRERLRAGDGLLYRYLSDDGVPGPEGAFAACSFWLADCAARQGDVDGARQVFEAAAAHASDLGLLAEEIDPASGDLRGNFPQAFTHLALLHAAASIDDAVARGESSGEGL